MLSGKGEEGSAFGVTISAQGFLAPTWVCAVHGDVAQRAVGHGKEQGVGQHQKDSKGQRGKGGSRRS